MKCIAASVFLLWIMFSGAHRSAMASVQNHNQGLSDDAIDGAGDRVMQDNDFRSVRRRVLERIEPGDADKGFLQEVMQWIGELLESVALAIGDFFRWLFGGSAKKKPVPPPPVSSSGGGSWFGLTLDGLSQFLIALVIVVIIAVVLVLISIVVKSAERRREKAIRPGAEQDEDLRDLSVPPGELPTNVYEHRALQLAGEGNFRAAVRELLLGSMSWIERAGLLRYRRGLTNRDYVRSVWRRQEKRDAFAVVALEFERLYFGRRAATEQRFLNCLAHFRGAFCEEEQPVAAI